MLVIKCKEDDWIRIGDEITIKVARIASIGRGVYLAIESPREMIIEGPRHRPRSKEFEPRMDPPLTPTNTNQERQE